MNSTEIGRREFLKAASSLALLPLAAQVRAESDLVHLTAAVAVERIHRGELKAEDYAIALLDRCESLASLRAFISLDRGRVLEAARAADRTRASGRTLGALHGIPIAIKDSINTADYATTSGTAALRNFRPNEDATLVSTLRAAGALVLGKTNLHELSYGWTSNNATFGAVRNPYDRSRVPGGSSGGTGAAIGARMAPLGIAEDTGGSTRVPAALCGVFGFRPTVGRYPTEGTMPITSLYDTLGPHARSVADIALFDQV